jgi:hypothetical protein
MIDFESHFKRLQDALEVKNALEKNCVDMIDEGLWWNVMYQLDQASIEAADELQAETGKPYPKDSRVMVAAKVNKTIPSSIYYCMISYNPLKEYFDSC